ncbi:RLA class I histocompatibility antigen, alpha chain 11/11 [Bagarius yarrelli]|uniref:RLA class I histocompatibility antigen, alpha chain 11/11 n=1 Tax=Bagarius yarrelli TaxID=175774 RepID=A0A556V0X9_BAGYA|nr:RLA class I histocompatibility antigen, alpha chain 11/11 [Bagarius yarrelli]
MLLKHFHLFPVTHTLQYLYTAVKEMNAPEFTAIGLVDGEQFMYYDSNSRKAMAKIAWLEKNEDELKQYWKDATPIYQGQENWFKDYVTTAMQSFNQTTGFHTMQFMYGCELNSNGSSRGYSKYGHDGEDFISLDLKTVSWTAAEPQTETKWDPAGHQARLCKDFLRYRCIERLKMFVFYGKKTLERKDPPTVSLFQKHSPSPEVVCHATGFFPKALMISWRKDGEDVLEDVELRETLPNQDGSFQQRSILKVSSEELQKHTYTCVIQHSSLEKEMLMEVPKGGASIALIAGVVAALVALVAVVVVGILIWKKKKNSGERRKEEDVKKPDLDTKH